MADSVARFYPDSNSLGPDARDDGDSGDAPDAPFLDDLQRRSYRFFIEAADPYTGFISDRAATDGSGASDHASSAACGFGLTAHSIAAKKGLVPRDEAAARTRSS